MELTVAQKNELATRLVEAQQSDDYGSFNDLVRQLRLTQKDLLDNFPAINQAGIDEQISLGAVVPTARPAAVTYTTQQVTKAIQDAISAGFTVQQAKMGAMTNFGLSENDFNKALDQVQNAPSTTFSDARVAQAIRDSLAQGFTLDQARQGALNNYGVGQSQFDRAMQLVDRSSMQFRGSAPTYQFPGLLADREQMPTGAQRFIARAPGSLLYDVPRVENAEFVFQPGAFDYNALRNQQAGVVDQIEGGNMPSKTIVPTSVKPATTPAAPVTTPVVKPPVTTPTTYTDARVAQALRESIAQGFSLLDSMAGAIRVYGIPQDQLHRAANVVATEQLNAPKNTTTMTTGSTTGLLTTPSTDTGLLSTTPVDTITAPVAPPTTIPVNPRFTDTQVAQAVMDALGQGFTLDQAQQGAFANFGVNQDQFGRAVGMLPSMGYTIGQGFR
jgi:hypothetical protein